MRSQRRQPSLVNSASVARRSCSIRRRRRAACWSSVSLRRERVGMVSSLWACETRPQSPEDEACTGRRMGGRRLRPTSPWMPARSVTWRTPSSRALCSGHARRPRGAARGMSSAARPTQRCEVSVERGVPLTERPTLLTCLRRSAARVMSRAKRHRYRSSLTGAVAAPRHSRRSSIDATGRLSGKDRFR